MAGQFEHCDVLCNRQNSSALTAMEFVPNVWIKVGIFSLDVITSVPEALAFLHGWPQERRGSFYYLAEGALQAAAKGTIPVAEARNDFCVFCREAGILAEDGIAK